MDFDDFWCKMKLRACLFRFCCFQHTFALLKTTKTFSEVKSVGFPLPNFQMCSVCNYWSSGCLRPRKYIIHAYNVGIHDKKFFQLLIRLHTHFRLLTPKITISAPIHMSQMLIPKDFQQSRPRYSCKLQYMCR